LVEGGGPGARGEGLDDCLELAVHRRDAVGAGDYALVRAKVLVPRLDIVHAVGALGDDVKIHVGRIRLGGYHERWVEIEEVLLCGIIRGA
jgi:hypothetical protein